jgi:hypothetical protein
MIINIRRFVLIDLDEAQTPISSMLQTVRLEEVTNILLYSG